MLTLSPFKLNGNIPARMPSQNNGFQGNRDKNSTLINLHLNRTSSQDPVKLSKGQPKFGADNENYTPQQELQIRRVMAEIAVVPHTNQRATEKIGKVAKSVGFHALVHWIGEHKTWLLEKISDFAHMIKDFVKDTWDKVIDWLFD